MNLISNLICLAFITIAAQAMEFNEPGTAKGEGEVQQSESLSLAIAGLSLNNDEIPPLVDFSKMAIKTEASKDESLLSLDNKRYRFDDGNDIKPLIESWCLVAVARLLEYHGSLPMAEKPLALKNVKGEDVDRAVNDAINLAITHNDQLKTVALEYYMRNYDPIRKAPNEGPNFRTQWIDLYTQWIDLYKSVLMGIMDEKIHTYFLSHPAINKKETIREAVEKTEPIINHFWNEHFNSPRLFPAATFLTILMGKKPN